jgi:MFS family permease
MSPGSPRQSVGFPGASQVQAFRGSDRPTPVAPPLLRGWGRGRSPAAVRGPALVLYGAALAYFTSIGAVIPTLPRYLVGPLHGSGVTVGIAVACFSAGAIAARLPVGVAADRWGWRRRSLLMAGATVLAISTALLIAGPSAPTVFVLRALAGIADALFYTAAAATA